MDTEQVREILKDYITSEVQLDHEELSEYGLGVLHGMEYALSLLEKRPVIYVQKDRTYTDHDKKLFPEYFV